MGWPEVIALIFLTPFGWMGLICFAIVITAIRG